MRKNKYTVYELQDEIKKIWSEELGKDLKINENYFLIGGNSLNAIRIVGEIKKLFDNSIDIPFSYIFSYLVEKCERPMTSYIYEWDRTFSLEHIRQEYPVYGTTDYRHPAIELLQENGSRISIALSGPRTGQLHPFIILIRKIQA